MLPPVVARERNNVHCSVSLLGQEFTDRDGSKRPMTEDDILVVTPYNVQVNYLRSILPDNAKFGTVDKF